MKQLHRNVAGFTLMEINLVLFLFGAGITAMLGIFPVGLRQAQYAFSDTVQVAFAAKVLSSLEASASEMRDRGSWADLGSFRSAVLSGVTVNGGKDAIQDTTERKNGIFIDNYLVPGNRIKYCLEFTQLDYDPNKGMLPYVYRDGIRKPPPRYRAALWVVDSKTGRPKSTKPYIADFQYLELVTGPGANGGGE